ncbi:hypothetical protein EBB07_26875 [Paenibacillaceae bacterium]|nr:hypothetical protein EBB07_26875 [Paenibacillaceae bacterium]
MRTQQEMEYDAFLALERSRYKDGCVTSEEKASFYGELELLRAYLIPDHIAPNAAYRGEVQQWLPFLSKNCR